MSVDVDADAETDLAPGLERAFEIKVAEGDFDVEPEGELPEWLAGTYFLNGPSHFPTVDGRHAYRHWLDADGAVSRLRFGGGGVRFTHRFVQSRKRLDEGGAGRLLYRGFGTSFEGDRLKRGIGLESPVNVSAFRFGDQLLAFGEQGLPYALDPVTLETRGEYDFGGRLNAISPLSAHPGFDRSGRELFNFGISFSARQPSLTLYRFSSDDLVYRRRHPLPYPCSTHDFMLSGRYAVFYLSPHVLDVDSMLRGGESVNGSLRWRPELGARLLVFERGDGALRADIPIDGVGGSGYCLHLINAFEADDRLTVDVVELERPVYDQYQPVPDLFVDAPSGGPRRYEVDLDAGAVVSKRSIDYELCPDFPAVRPQDAERPYDDLWLLGISAAGRRGRKFFDQLAHLRWSAPDAPDVWTAPAGGYLGGEPVFLSNPEDPGDGLILCQLFEAPRRESSFLLFDAARVADGPVSRLPLEHPMPLGFHAVYYPDVE
ncbi:MAG: carotenoid oxygenase family protein [Acidobacteriota bacterium]